VSLSFFFVSVHVYHSLATYILDGKHRKELLASPWPWVPRQITSVAPSLYLDT